MPVSAKCACVIKSRYHRVLLLALPLIIGLGLFFLFGSLLTRAAAGLSVEYLAGYNLVVDSNPQSPASAAPDVATVAGRFCNTNPPGGDTLHDVMGYIGDYVDGVNDTPGVYPARDSLSFDPAHPLYDTGVYSFNHLGGQMGTTDATRYIGDLAPGECSVQYWHFTYPQCSEADRSLPCSDTPVWGDSVKPEDDLWLVFDIWARADDVGVTYDAPWKMTMRNEISAMANKIEPNPDGRWFNTVDNVVRPGEVITSNGILYEFGVINQGFDNDGDFVPDYNAWAQPFGDPAYDPSCFRLIRTSTTLTITRSGGNPPLILNAIDQLYFTNLPDDNTGVRGEIHYTFISLGGECTIPLSPYQEVASGKDNEKFNADYGTGVPPISGSEPEVTINKLGPDRVAENVEYTYTIPFVNTGDAPAGLTLSTGDANMPLVVQDTVPDGLEYICNQTSATLDYTPSSPPGYTLRFSKDSGSTWTTDETSFCSGGNPISDWDADQAVIVQWWLGDPLPRSAENGSGEATYHARVPTGYILGGGDVMIDNCAQLSFGEGAPFDEACKTTLVEGNLTIGDLVWQDEDGNGIWKDVDGDGVQDPGDELGLNNVKLSLYWDKDGDGALDEDDIWIADTSSATSGSNNGIYSFNNLPNGDYLVVVDHLDSDLPTGYTPTTPRVHAVTLAGANYLAADFGFGPSLRVEKHLESYDPAYVGEEVVFHVNLTNNLPGDGTPTAACQYKLWAATTPPADGTPVSYETGNRAWQNTANALWPPNDQYAWTVLSNSPDEIGLSGFNLSGQTGLVQNVRVVLYLHEIAAMQSGDTMDITVYRNNAPADTLQLLGTYFDQPTGSTYVYTSPNLAGSWSLSDFTNNLTELHVKGTKGLGSVNGDIGLDAAAFVVTTDQSCGGADTVISYLPVQDTYDPAVLDYLSADPLPTAVNETTGVIDWGNLGPLYPGQTKMITLHFRALATAAPTTNTAESSGAKFSSGRFANDGWDDATVNINTPGSISGRLWADDDNDGWQGTTGKESGVDWDLPNVRLELWICINNLTGLPEPPTYSNQNCAGRGGTFTYLRDTYTASDGTYSFQGLRDGFYHVRVDETTLPAGFTTRTGEATFQGNGAGTGTGAPCASCDGQWNVMTATLRATNFNSIDNTAGADNITNVSFGYRNAANGMVYGYVWYDQDQDGVWDVGELPISNTTVYLCTGTGDCTTSGTWVTTDARGNYTFSGLIPGTTYRVGVAVPPGMSQSGDPDVAGNCGGSCDNQANTFTVTAGDVAGPKNFGYFGGLDIGDTIYTDWDGDGHQGDGNPANGDEGEEGISGVVVYLYRDLDGDGIVDAGVDTLLGTDTTDASGFYEFTDLPGNGNHYLVVVGSASLPAGYIQTGDPDSTQDGKTQVTLTDSDVDTADFGYQPRALNSVGDLVWLDSDGDGVYDPGEAGVSGVSLSLYHDHDGDGALDPEDAFVASQTTGAGGVYNFANLPDGSFIVQVDLANFTSGQPLNGLTQTNGSGDNLHSFSVSGGQNYTEADFGYGSSAVGDFVWQDNDGDGSQDTTEPGIAGVLITLYVDNDGDGKVSAGDTVYDYDRNGQAGSAGDTLTTDWAGYYEFTGLPAGDYVVLVESSNFDPGGALDGFHLTYDPDAYSSNPSLPFPPCDAGNPDYVDCDNQNGVTLTTGQTDRSSDFGYRPQGVIGDFVWLDRDEDGVQDSTEPGIAGVRLYLSDGACEYPDSNGNPNDDCPSVVTDSDGYYTFGNVPDGTYTVFVVTGSLPSGLAPTYDKDSGTSSPDNHSAVTLSGGNTDLTIDFGYWFDGEFSIDGTVFFDAGNDGGLYGQNNPPYDISLAGVTVYLYSVNCGLDDTCGTSDDGPSTQLTSISTTGSTGAYNYIFDNLPAGDYALSVDTGAPQLVGMTLTSEPDDTTCAGNPACNAFTYVRLSTASMSDMDFGFWANMDCGDLPNTYRTITTEYATYLADQGPCHIGGTAPGAPGTHYMGVGVDWDDEPDGQESSHAMGDDLNGDDEDGVLVISPATDWFAGQTVQLQITSVTGDNAYLAGWFDWNHDGNFTAAGGYDDGEYVYFGHISGASIILNVTIPASSGCCSINYPLNARFRLYKGESPPPVISPTGNVSDGEVEDYQWPLGPTAVTMGEFTASTGARKIVLNWDTAMEMDTVGFNVYRASDVDGQRVRLNSAMIPSQAIGGIGGGYYEFIDTDVESGVTYFYWLEYLDIYGSTIFGPVEATWQGIYLPFVVH